jgi:outer membrane protein OmpA-like peptidoglycan-associated protein
MNKLVLSLVLVLFAFTGTSFAQEEKVDKEMVRIAHKLYKQKSYSSSLRLYLELDSIVDGDIEEYQYYIALCYLKQREDRTKAIPYLENNRAYFYELGLEEDYFFLLAQAYHLDYRFDEAILAYDKFIHLSGKRDKRKKEVERWIDMCMDAKSLISSPVQVDIQNLGSKVNSAKAEHTPVISADESVIIFNSNRKGSIGGMMNIFGQPDTVYGHYFDDIYVSININDNWLKPVKIGAGLNTPQHDDVVSISPDGQTLFIYRSDSMVYGNLFYCELMGYSWGPLHKLPAPINSKYWENSGSISSDGNTFYMSSNRPGATGDGDFDIYMIRRLPDGSWAEPQNLGNMINTKYDEYAPFIHPDGKSLYFSSKGHNSMGGYDIFKSTLLNGKWSIPVNLGHPINTPDDDVDFVLSGDGKRGYYSSARPGGSGEKDIYVINFNSEYKDLSPGPVTLFKGTITTCDQQAANNAQLKVFDNISGELMGVYRPNSATGKYMVIIPKGIDYNIEVTADNYQTYNLNVVTAKNEPYLEEESNFVLCPVAINDACVAACEDGSFIEKSVAEVIVDISSVIAEDDNVVTIKNRELSINVWKNDVAAEGELKKEDIIVLDKPLHGALDYDDSFGEFDYQPSLSFTGVDSFSYKICATNGDCDEAMVYIKVNDPSVKNQLPEVNDDEFTVYMDTVMDVNVLENDIDHDGKIEFRSFKIMEQVTNGTLTMDHDLEKVMYSPNKGYKGDDQFSYQVCDNNNYCNTAKVTLHITDEIIEELVQNNTPEVAEALKAVGVEASETAESWEDQAIGEQITVYNVYFNYDKSFLREDSKENLADLIEFLTKYPKLKIEVGAHTDSRGAEWYNKNLSQQRASEVKAYFVKRGVNSNNIEASGYGETSPVHKCETDEACSEEQHQLNRRTTFVLSGDKLKLTSVKPAIVEIDPRPGSAFIKQIDERNTSASEKNAMNDLLIEKALIKMQGLEYIVQIAAFNAEVKDNQWFEGIEVASKKRVKAQHYRYYSKSFKTLAEANTFAKELRSGKNKYAFAFAKLNGSVLGWKALKDILIK